MLDKLVVKLLVLKMWAGDEHGQDLAEYALLTGGIAILLVTAVGLLSGDIQAWVNRMGGWFTNLSPK